MKLRVTSILLVLLLVSGAAWTLEDNLSDFMFEDMVDTWWDSGVYLYPDISTATNPSVALDIDRVLLFPAIDLRFPSYDFDYGFLTDTVETIPEPLANAGGTLATTESVFDFRNSGVSAYIPLDDEMVVGAELSGGVYKYSFEEADAEYSTTGETVTEKYEDTRSRLSVGGLFAIGLDALDLGVAARYRRTANPGEEEFGLVSGEPGAPETYFTDLGYDTTAIITNTVEGIVGTRLTREALEFGVGAGFTSATTNRETSYVIVDTDSDGFNDTVVTLQEQQTSTEPWGAGGFYESKDETKTTVVAIYPHLLYRISDPLSLVASGYWYPIDTVETTEYTRTTETDESIQTTTTDSGLANFGVLAGVEWRPVSKVELRSGLGFEFRKTTYSRENLDATGASTYDANNTNNLVEDALGGVEPGDDDVVTNGGLESVTDQRVSVLTGVMWNPVPRVRFYSDADFSILFQKDEYKLYDIDSGDVWSETDEDSDLDWWTDALVGFAFKMSDSITLGMETNSRLFSTGNRNRVTDSLPTGPDGETTNPGGNLENTMDEDFWLYLYLIIGL